MRKCGIDFDGPDNHLGVDGEPPIVPMGKENGPIFLKIPGLSL